jgi:Uma2 family endonuclease
MLDPAELGPDALRPLSRAEYDRLLEAGAFEGERVELLYGWLVAMTPQSPQHFDVIQRLMELLLPPLMDRATVRCQGPLPVFEHSVPEPDIAIVERRRYDEHPSRAWVVIEVAWDSLRKDRRIKARLYAEAAIPEYWIVNLVDGVVEVYARPEAGEYAEQREARGDDALEVLGVRFTATELLGQ